MSLEFGTSTYLHLEKTVPWFWGNGGQIVLHGPYHILLRCTALWLAKHTKKYTFEGQGAASVRLCQDHTAGANQRLNYHLDLECFSLYPQLYT